MQDFGNFNYSAQVIFFLYLKKRLQNPSIDLSSFDKTKSVTELQHLKNEALLDEFFFHELRANYLNRSDSFKLNESDFNILKAFTVAIPPNMKIDFFTNLFQSKEISFAYYSKTISRYKVPSLQTLCNYTIFTSLGSPEQITQLPLPTTLKNDLNNLATQSSSFNPR